MVPPTAPVTVLVPSSSNVREVSVRVRLLPPVANDAPLSSSVVPPPLSVLTAAVKLDATPSHRQSPGPAQRTA